MSSNHTANYNLSQWEKSDKVLMEDFNADNAKIDAALGGLASSVSGLWGTVSGLSTALGKKGSCQMYVTSYAATRESGADHPTSVTFPKKPILVLVTNGGIHAVMVQGRTSSWAQSQAGGEGSITVSWKDNTVSWYSLGQKGQLNEYGTYTVLALLDAES